MGLTDEIIEKARLTKTIDELKKIAFDNNIVLSEGELEKYFKRFSFSQRAERPLEDFEIISELKIDGAYESGEHPRVAVGTKLYDRHGLVSGIVTKCMGKNGSFSPEFYYECSWYDNSYVTYEWEMETLELAQAYKLLGI